MQHVNRADFLVDLPHVGQDGNAGPVSLEDLSAVRVGLAEPSRLSAERSMDGKVESSDTAEEGAAAHFTIPP